MSFVSNIFQQIKSDAAKARAGETVPVPVVIKPQIKSSTPTKNVIQNIKDTAVVVRSDVPVSEKNVRYQEIIDRPVFIKNVEPEQLVFTRNEMIKNIDSDIRSIQNRQTDVKEYQSSLVSLRGDIVPSGRYNVNISGRDVETSSKGAQLYLFMTGIQAKQQERLINKNLRDAQRFKSFVSSQERYGTSFIKTGSGYDITFDPKKWEAGEDARARRDWDFGYLIGKPISRFLSRGDYMMESLRSGYYTPESGLVIGGEKLDPLKMGSDSSILSKGHYDYYKMDWGNRFKKGITSEPVMMLITAGVGAGVSAVGAAGYSATIPSTVPFLGGRAVSASTVANAGFVGMGAYGTYSTYQQGGMKAVEEQIKRAAIMSPLFIGAYQTGQGYGGQIAYKAHQYQLGTKIKTNFGQSIFKAKQTVPGLSYTTQQIKSFPRRSSNAYWNRQTMLRDRALGIKYGEIKPNIIDKTRMSINRAHSSYNEFRYNQQKFWKQSVDELYYMTKERPPTTYKEFGYRITEYGTGEYLAEKILPSKQSKLGLGMVDNTGFIKNSYKGMEYYDMPTRPMGSIPKIKPNVWKQLFPPGTGERYDFIKPEYRLSEPTVFSNRFTGQKQLTQSFIDSGKVKPIVTIKPKTYYLGMEYYDMPTKPMTTPPVKPPSIWKQLFPEGTGESMMIDKYKTINQQAADAMAKWKIDTTGVKVRNLEFIKPQKTLNIKYYGDVNIKFTAGSKLKFYEGVKEFGLPDKSMGVEYIKPTKTSDLFSLMEKPYTITETKPINIKQFEWYQTPIPEIKWDTTNISTGGGYVGGYAAAYGFVGSYDIGIESYIHPRWVSPVKSTSLRFETNIKPVNITGYKTGDLTKTKIGELSASGLDSSLGLNNMQNIDMSFRNIQDNIRKQSPVVISSNMLKQQLKTDYVQEYIFDYNYKFTKTKFPKPPPPILDFGGGSPKVKRKPMTSLGSGYRFRRWNVIRMEDFLGGI